MVAYSFKKRFVAPIRIGLSKISLSFDVAPKRQTIRAIGRRRHARPGETLQLYTAMRTKQCAKIGDARCTAVTPIKIKFDDVVFWVIIPVSSSRMARISGDQLEQFAMADGFSDSVDMAKFWREEHGDAGCTFEGIVIQWEPL